LSIQYNIEQLQGRIPRDELTCGLQ
jgi:hypothetical protein